MRKLVGIVINFQPNAFLTFATAKNLQIQNHDSTLV